MSGADASNGIPTDNGVVLAVEEANEKGLPGGIAMLDFDQVLDDAVQGVHDPAAGAKTSRRSSPTPVLWRVVGPFNSNVAQAEIPDHQ